MNDVRTVHVQAGAAARNGVDEGIGGASKETRNARGGNIQAACSDVDENRKAWKQHAMDRLCRQTCMKTTL